jgi:hypothetical protein
MPCCWYMATTRGTSFLSAIFYHIRHSLYFLSPCRPALSTRSYLLTSHRFIHLSISHLLSLTTFSYPPLILTLSSTFPPSLQDISPGLLLSCWSHTISSSLAGTYDHRQSTAGVVGLLAHAMLINKSQVRACLDIFLYLSATYLSIYSSISPSLFLPLFTPYMSFL